LIRQSVILKETIEEKEKETEQLKKQVRSLEDAESPIISRGNEGAKEKIQDLVREIDRCIELLNK
jgi:sugar-specific transcriptional regulator TrmB